MNIYKITYWGSTQERDLRYTYPKIIAVTDDADVQRAVEVFRESMDMAGITMCSVEFLHHVDFTDTKIPLPRSAHRRNH